MKTRQQSLSVGMLLLAACSGGTIEPTSTDNFQLYPPSQKHLPDGRQTIHWPHTPGHDPHDDAGTPAAPDMTTPPTPSPDMTTTPTPAPDMATTPKPSPDMATTPKPSPDMTAPPAPSPDMTAPPAPSPDMSSPPTTTAHVHHRCGWLLGVPGGMEYNDFVANAAYFDAVHPAWYALASDGTSLRTVTGEGDAAVWAAVKANHLQVIPMIASVDDPTLTRSMLLSSTMRATHINNLVQLTVTKGYDGVDIDYEHLRNTGDQPAFTEFMKELSVALHAAGKELSVALDPAAYYSADLNDYVGLSAVCDHLHVMGYDFHTVGTHAGPTAPLGYIEQVDAYAQSTGHPEKFILALPNYGVTPTWYCTLADCATTCPSATEGTTEMQSCPFNTEFNWSAGMERTCSSPNGQLFFDEVASLEQKVQSAKAHGFTGITYWAIGGEPAGFFAMIRKYY